STSWLDVLACLQKLSLITDGIESCPAQKFTISRQQDILGREANIESSGGLSIRASELQSLMKLLNDQ
ncbi:hypothetical protein AVEN_161804-1, partial [Araneus ventricosus]